MRALTPLGLLAAATVLTTAGAATAGDQAPRATHASNGRAVLVCQSDAATRRAFIRDYGSAPVFVTAREALSVRPTDPAWTAPRCMTARQHALYVQAANTHARAR